jgi:hypothetical protein
MKTFIVSHLSYFDNVLQAGLVKATDWRDALNQVPSLEHFSTSACIEDAKADAFDADVALEIVEITDLI